MFVYFNENPLGKNVGDCVIRAILKAENKSWETVYSELCLQGFSMADMPSSNAVWGAYLSSKGYRRYIIPNTCPDCYTIGDFARDNPSGTFIVATGSHVVSVIDGDIYDSWHSENEIPTYFFHKED